MQRLQIVIDMEGMGLTRRQALKAVIAAQDLKYFRIAGRLDMSQGHLSNLLNGQRDATNEVLDQIEAAIAAEIPPPLIQATA